MSGIKHAKCRKCNGEGEAAGVRCSDCHGDGWIKCTSGGGDCPFSYCYCEAAWERQQEDRASEPSPSFAEQHQSAWPQKQELKRR